MINQTTKNKIKKLFETYRSLSKNNRNALQEIAAAETPEMVYNSNAIENSTLTLKDTEDILLRNKIKRDISLREVFEAQNLAKITEILFSKPKKIEDKILLANIDDKAAGRFRRGKEWVRAGAHIGANPAFTNKLMSELVNEYNNIKNKAYFLDKIAYFHAEFETIHQFCDGNGRIGRLLINQHRLSSYNCSK